MFPDASTESNMAFYNKITFQISESIHGCLLGEGLVFVIASRLNSPAQSMGLPSKADQFFVVEFHIYVNIGEWDLEFDLIHRVDEI